MVSNVTLTQESSRSRERDPVSKECGKEQQEGAGGGGSTRLYFQRLRLRERGRQIREFKASVVYYRESSRAVRTTQRNPVLRMNGWIDR